MAEPDKTDESAAILPFYGGGSCPVQYDLDFEGHHYYVRYRHGWLTIEIDDREILCQQLAPEPADDGEWSDEATNVYISLISDAIRHGTLETLALPAQADAARHPLYHKGPLPRYCLTVCNRRHLHTSDCYGKETYSARELEEYAGAIKTVIHAWRSLAEVGAFALARHGFGNTDGGCGIHFPDDQDDYDREHYGAIRPGFIRVYGNWGLPDGCEFEVPESLYRETLVQLLIGAGFDSLADDIANSLPS